MEKRMNLIAGISYKEFYAEIKAQNGISDLWIKILEMLENLQEGITDDALKLFCIYFSLMDDGNTCIALDESILLKKWMAKWDGLQLVSEKKSDFNEDDFRELICSALIMLNEKTLPNLICEIGENPITVSEATVISKPFSVKKINGTDWLFSTKYFVSKISIESRIKQLFHVSGRSDSETASLSENELDSIIQYFAERTNVNASSPEKQKLPILLNKKQAEVVLRGQNENLIVTGGPGTGKTTAVCYLLWKLLQNKDCNGKSYLDYNLYLAAPSGKAAERMKESITDSLKFFEKNTLEEFKEIEQKLSQVNQSTIHRLLSFNPAKNGFNFNSENQFEKNSILIIDEASMIDIGLFKCLLEAIPDGARYFILGDKDQLPSVQAGAVLGELLGKIRGSVVELTESNRFNSSSQVGRFKDEIQKSSPLPEDLSKFGTTVKNIGDINFADPDSSDPNPVFFYDFGADKKNELKELAYKWSETFCEDFIGLCKSLSKDISEEPRLEKLWKKSLRAKILCAERKGETGVQNLNRLISEKICRNHQLNQNQNQNQNQLNNLNLLNLPQKEYFDGQLLILTKNQKMYNLYNGDCGIVVSFKNLGGKFFMIEKADISEDSAGKGNDQGEGIFRIGKFMFYPMSLLPGDSIETAYAITIHKSQGSGYRDIMVFLPVQQGHPLLNRQIFYTAITRTKKNAYIIASKDAMNYAKASIIERDTMIEIQ